MPFPEQLPDVLGPGVSLGGLPPGAAAYALAARGDAPAWIVVPTREDADRFERALRTFLPKGRVRLYPADDTRPWDGTSPDPDLPRLRMAARAGGAIVVAPAKALLLKVPATVERLRLTPGDTLDREALVRWACARGYLVTQRVEDPATISVRGGVLDLWPATARRPVRVDLFDDEIESLRPFDPETQRLLARPGQGKPTELDRVDLLPAREAILDEWTADRAAAWMHAVAQERGESGPYRRVLADLRNGVWFPGAEAYLPALVELAPLALPDPVFLVEPERIVDELAAAEAQIVERFEATAPEDRPLVRPFDRYLRAAEVRLEGTPIRRLVVREAGRTTVDFACRDNRSIAVTGADVEPLVRALRADAEQGRAVTLTVESETRAENVRALLASHGLELGEGRARPGEITLERAELPEGFVTEHLRIVTAAELFGDKLGEHGREHGASERATQRIRRITRKSFGSVQRGDFVVHSRHGIGLYAGLARLPLGVGEGDFAVVEYRDGQKLYVPLDRLDLLSPYESAGGATPRLDKLGGATWDARKAKVRDAVLRLASDLLLLYARQKLATAPVLEHSDEMYWRFAEAFPFVETPDQETAIHEVLDDLQSGTPMDRLVVGDVGFGKTEVAMRAAMVAVLGGRQVAVLCPTSVLALQHGESFRRRFAGFPVSVEVLSRLVSPTREREVREKLESGKVDIVVGTTALLSRSLRFRSLGLVVIDEEHRFGTAQKEELKRRFAGIHTLALSATPIPRTLQMSLSGLRTLSVLATPPLGRQRIRTEVVRFSPERIREDVLYELRRGGQVYFVHNRVQSIEGVARWLRKLVPEAEIVVAHGQMKPTTLERALDRFIRADANVLVSTAIIESGVDLPLVNTMIVNRAELFGAAQLYQLRGRIGRGSVRGHCTILVAGAGETREAATERLRALQEHDEWGSNFALATRDLELRGSGDILGDKQHGHIAAIGFDAYLELLDEAVARARGDFVRMQIDPDVEVALPCHLPDAWIGDVPERLDAYQRIASCRTRAQVRTEMATLEERFGEPPPEARNLGWLAEARIRCRDLGIERIAVLKVRAVVRLHASSPIQAATIDALATRLPNRIRRTGPQEVEVRITPDEATLPFRVIDWVCSKLSEKPA